MALTSLSSWPIDVCSSSKLVEKLNGILKKMDLGVDNRIRIEISFDQLWRTSTVCTLKHSTEKRTELGGATGKVDVERVKEPNSQACLTLGGVFRMLCKLCTVT